MHQDLLRRAVVQYTRTSSATMPLVIMASLSAVKWMMVPSLSEVEARCSAFNHTRDWQPLTKLSSVLCFRRDQRQVLAQLDQVLVAVLPVREHGELVDELLLGLCQCHCPAYRNILTAFLVAATMEFTSSTVLKHAKLARVVPLTPKRSINGWVQWWPVRTAMPCWSSRVPRS
jgi:hypothetical protein